MLKPVKVWKVGDEEFVSYAEANQAAVRKRKTSVRDEIVSTLSKNINWEGCSGGDDDLELAVDLLLTRFHVSRRRKASLRVVSK